MGTSRAYAQLDARQLIGDSVDDVGPEYQDIEDAITRFRNRDIQGAQQLLDAAQKRHPQLPPAGVMLAKLYVFASDFANAGNVLEAVVKSDPDDPEAFITLGDLSFRERHFAAADALYRQGNALCAGYARNPKRKESLELRSHAGLAAVAEARENWQDAETHLQAVVQKTPDNAAFQARLGRALYKLGKTKEAYDLFTKLHDSNNTVARAEVTMGLLYYADGLDATKLFRLAAERDSDGLNTRLAAAKWALDTGKIDMAKEHVRKALQIDPESFDGHYLAGLVARHEGDYATAESEFEAAHNRSPSNFETVNNLVLTLIDQEDTDKRRRASEFAQINVRVNSDLNQPSGREAAITLGWVLFQLGREANAEQTIQQALRTPGGVTAEAAYLAAKVYNDRGQPQAARQLLSLALDRPTAFPKRKEAEQLLAQLNGN
jgi:tetratricopeptide (TPR) repeat protein